VRRTANGAYKPLFFSSQQFQMIEHLTDMIIPTDETPGAKEAGVAEFIDFMVATEFLSVLDATYAARRMQLSGE